MKRFLKRIGLGFLAVLVLAVAYLLLWPVDIDPAAWDPPKPPALEGIYARNAALAQAERFGSGGLGPEDIAIDGQGRMVTGLEDGRIVRIGADGAIEDWVNTGGRPLGLDWDARGNLIVADADRGLLSVSPEGEIDVLATEHGGVPFRFTDDVDVGADGVYYFSDASHKFPVSRYVLDLLEHRPNGRLLAYDPTTRETRLVMGDLYFANGVAVADDASYVLVNETGKYRVTRVWLTGERRGQHDVLIDNLPGFPDGISTGTGGVFWIALASPRDASVDATLPRPFLRKVMARLPAFLRPAPKRHGFVLGIDGDGNVVANLQDPSPTSFSPITSVEEHGGFLYLGTIGLRELARTRRPAL